MSTSPGAKPGSISKTAPAGSRETENRVYVGPRIVAREFARLFAEKGIAAHPAEVRKLAGRFCADEHSFGEVEAFALAYTDPTGETAARNVDRERGGRGGA